MTLPQAGWRSRASAARAVNRQRWTGAGAAAVDPDYGATAAPQGYAAPMVRMQAAKAMADESALAVEGGKAVVTATVSGSVQMK